MEQVNDLKKELFGARESAASYTELCSRLVDAFEEAEAAYVADRSDANWQSRQAARDRMERAEVDAQAARQRVVALEHQIESDRRQALRDRLAELEQRTSRSALAERLTPSAEEIASLYERLGVIRAEMQSVWDELVASHRDANAIRQELHRIEIAELSESERAELNAGAFTPLLPDFEGGHSALDRFVQACRAAIADRGINPDNRARLIPGA